MKVCQHHPNRTQKCNRKPNVAVSAPSTNAGSLPQEKCQHGELGALLRREGLTYAQIGKWRKAVAEGTVDKKRGPVANSNCSEMRRLEAENARLKRQLERAEAIIDAQKKLARLL